MATEIDLLVEEKEPRQRPSARPYDRPAGGWGSVKSVARSLLRERVVASAPPALLRQNKPDGFACVSCAWAKPAEPHPFEFCEKAPRRRPGRSPRAAPTPDFFAAAHAARARKLGRPRSRGTGPPDAPDALGCGDRQIRAGRLGGGVRARSARELKALDPKIGRVLRVGPRLAGSRPICTRCFARLYGNNNLPDSSNMCHESTSVALPESIGVPVGTVTLDDFAETDCIFFFGQNVGINSPRMLHDLQDARSAACRSSPSTRCASAGSIEFTNPQTPGRNADRRVDADQLAVPPGQGRRRHGGADRLVQGAARSRRRCQAQRRPPCSMLRSSTSTRTASTSSPPRCAAHDWAEIEQRSGLVAQRHGGGGDRLCAAPTRSSASTAWA